ncbi:iron-sulfur cluster repair protein YtfE [Microbulbifer marinus]|uniref:Regulator of cell morphogenesis and NO signaling n=1 Tax=Microbulbifer marinus TaxID=658218 RepID=A0A1H3X2N6_9GAMM|nr:iron-sulfur cluster repair protein YtfE [Microbulbifer marinus]SDZ92902.1 regulator of cell morphogenesis and NO signaling [Microbulbifer marinus]
MDLLDLPLARLAREIPGATAVFNRHGLSFCSGGEKTLRTAIANAHLNQQQILAALLELTGRADDSRDWREASDGELIEHLLERFHQVHREQLAELHRLAERVENTHYGKPDCPRGLAEHLRHMAAELEQHMQKEEQILFPMLAHGQGAMAGGPIQVMLHEHDEHAAAIARIDELTDGITTPEDACNSWRALYAGLRSFKADLEKHIQLENNILFARNLAA